MCKVSSRINNSVLGGIGSLSGIGTLPFPLSGHETLDKIEYILSCESWVRNIESEKKSKKMQSF